MDQHIVDNLNIKSIHFVGLSDKHQADLDFLDSQETIRPLGITLEKTRDDKELSRTLRKRGGIME